MNEVPQKVGPQPRVHWSESATSEMFDPAEAPYCIVVAFARHSLSSVVA
jgi:hypothetical protein